MQDSPNLDRIGETVGDSAYRRIRTDVIFGRLEPGQKLKLEKMSAVYGTSVSTLRETLNRLCSEGFVVAEGQRGFEVTSISADEFRQIAELRELLEGHAIEESFKSGDLDWEARVVSAHHKLASMERSMLAGDKSKTETWKQCDWQFITPSSPRAAQRCCWMPTLRHTTSIFDIRCWRWYFVARSPRSNIRNSWTQHFAAMLPKLGGSCTLTFRTASRTR